MLDNMAEEFNDARQTLYSRNTLSTFYDYEWSSARQSTRLVSFFSFFLCQVVVSGPTSDRHPSKKEKSIKKEKSKSKSKIKNLDRNFEYNIGTSHANITWSTTLVVLHC